ncbi:ribosome maturation protein [Cercophora newfieldiana]|uniref:Ribosome maturation protein n=1 Tax=Cercophora newfieldiana TaxID=92897 RepID=A0AA39YRI1_9PEZI|nr:ribosome maturation protein [Cercophora newfieldiana]
MPRGETTQQKVHFKGKDDDFVVFLDSADDYKKWLNDKSIPLAQVVSSFKIFVTHKHGAQGPFDGASKGALENEFGTHVDDEVIKSILEKGTLQESQMEERQGNTNVANGSLGGH